MKRITIYLMFLSVFISSMLNAQNSDKVTRVLVYKPAPGQHTNRLYPSAAMSNTEADVLTFASNCLVGNKSMLGLGSFGGYVVVGFDHPIVNVPGEYDFKTLGNAFAGSAEPGIVMVCQDLNKNGIPDPHEPWYELAGSEYKNPSTIHNYEITYHRPDPDGKKSNIRWTDNQGGEGVVTHISFASQATMYPLWVKENTLTYKGTLLADNAIQNGTMWSLPSLNWGYADNQPNNTSNDKIGFNIDWAVDDSGNSVHLESIDFVKVYTAMVQEAGWLGETSTELAGIVDLHPNQILTSNPPAGTDYITLDLQNTATLSSSPLLPNTHWSETYSENVYLEAQNFIFSHRNGWGGAYWDGFTISNHADNTDYGIGDSAGWIANQWGSMAKGGVNGEGSNFLVGYWGAYNDATAQNVTETSNYVMFNDGKTYKANGVYVNNSPWPYYGCLNGDQFARKFVKGDYLKLIAKGFAADGITQTGSTEFYLADYRSVNPVQWKLNTNWEWMDLTVLGEVSYIQFTMESTDSEVWGMNTAGLFCLDKLTVQKVNNPGTSTYSHSQTIKAYRSGNTLYNLPQGAEIQIVRLNGTVYYQGKITSSEMKLPANEFFIVKIQSNDNRLIIK